MFRLRLTFAKFSGDGAEGIRTPDPLLARQVLSQLSYNPLGLYGLKRAFSSFRRVTPMGLSGPFLLPKGYPDGLKWTRTTDLTLIRRAL